MYTQFVLPRRQNHTRQIIVTSTLAHVKMYVLANSVPLTTITIMLVGSYYKVLHKML